MRRRALWIAPVAAFVLLMGRPSAATAQIAVPSDSSPAFTIRFPPGTIRPMAEGPVGPSARPAPPVPRTKPNWSVFIRLYGGFIVGDRTVTFSPITVTGFLVVAGAAIPIAHREDMEIQVDLSYFDYSGGWYHPGGGVSLDGHAIGPTALYLYNFTRKGRSMMPFVGGGLGFLHRNENKSVVYSNPFQGGKFDSQAITWVFGPQGVGGVQFASKSRVTFRVEGRLGLTFEGLLIATLAGISF